MINQFKVHFWKINGYININFKFKKYIKQKILSKNSINKFSSNIDITGVSLSNFINNANSFIKIRNLVQISKRLNIPLNLLEKQIITYKDANRGQAIKIKFPYKFTPIDMRIVGVIFGDGNIHKTNNMARWVQKDITPLKNLIEYLLNIQINSHTNNNQITIPAFFTKTAQKILNLKQIELNTYKIIEKCLNLPKDYKLALLIAIIEDEGNIDIKNYGGISIRISSKQGSYFIYQLCKSLGYKTSNIIKYKNKGGFGSNIMYKINISSDGIKDLGYDLINFEKKYGSIASLWKKRDAFYKRWEICNGIRAKKNKEGAELNKKIILLFKKYDYLSPKKVSIKIDINPERVQNIMRRMYNNKKIKRIKRGVYRI